MIHLKTSRFFIFLFVFIFSFLISSILYYHTKIELFENDLHKVDTNLSWIELTYINWNDNTTTDYFSNWLTKDIFSNLQTENTTIYLSDLYWTNLIQYLKNFESYCIDYHTINTCNIESLWEIKQKYYDFSSFITDIWLFKKLWFKLEKDTCYIRDNENRYYIDENSIYAYNLWENSLTLEYIKRDEENRKVQWKQVSEPVNKIKERIILNRYSSNNYFIKYTKCEQSGKIKSI